MVIAIFFSVSCESLDFEDSFEFDLFDDWSRADGSREVFISSELELIFIINFIF